MIYNVIDVEAREFVAQTNTMEKAEMIIRGLSTTYPIPEKSFRIDEVG